MLVGQKHDHEKPRTDLVPPRPVMEMARVLAYGAGKYADNNWREVPDATRRYIGAALRHILQFMSGEKLDPESGLSHLAHAFTSIAFVIELDGNPGDFIQFKRPERPTVDKPAKVVLSEKLLQSLVTAAREQNSQGGLIGTIRTDQGEVDLYV